MKALVYDVRPIGWGTCKWLKLFWPGCLFSGLNGLGLRELPPPALPADDWVRCRTILGGICGSDLSVLLQRQPPDSILQSFSTLPMVMGHESVSVVEQVGPAADRGWLGKRVCVEPTLACAARGIDPPCPSCRRGQFGVCESFSANGLGRSRLPPGTSIGYCGPVGGAWGECFVAHQSQLVEPPAGLNDRQAVLTDPLACSLHAALKIDLRDRGPQTRASAFGDSVGSVLVYGAGILGLGAVWALRAIGYAGSIDVIARHPHQHELARRRGATETLRLPENERDKFDLIAARTGGRVTRARLGNFMLTGGYDAVLECVGSRRTITEALKWTRAGGQVVLLATGHGRGADLTPVWFTELRIQGAYGRGEESFNGRRVPTYKLVHELMAATKLNADELLTHTFPLADYRAAFAAATGKGRSHCVKAAFEFKP